MTIFPPWFVAPLGRLVALGERMPHAILLVGPSGVGKRVFGRALSRALLCESTDAVARGAGGCGVCPACLWFDQGNHPDFRRLTSEAIAVAEGVDSEDGDDAEVDAEPAKGRKTPSREIKVEQVRGLQRMLSVAAHRGDHRVVLLYPLEALNDVGANALLKMLEEPPPRTVFILAADHVGRVPATVVSRCRRVLVAAPPPGVAATWLREQGLAEPDAVLALCGGAPFAARDLAGDPAALQAHRELTRFLAAPGVDAALATAESFARAAPAPLVRWMQLWLADCIAARLAQRVRYHPTQSRAIVQLAGSARVDAMLGLMQRLTAIRRTVDHPLNTRLMLENLLVGYADAMIAAS